MSVIGNVRILVEENNAIRFGDCVKLYYRRFSVDDKKSTVIRSWSKVKLEKRRSKRYSTNDFTFLCYINRIKVVDYLNYYKRVVSKVHLMRYTGIDSEDVDKIENVEI